MKDIRDEVEVEYSSRHWATFRSFRAEALRLVRTLKEGGLRSQVHGSVARGDVKKSSDVDVFVDYAVPSQTVEMTLEKGEYRVFSRKIAQATPRHTPKAHVFLDSEEKRSVTFPIGRLANLELQFYYFGGVVGLEELEQNRRVSGVDKRLRLINPTVRGHREYSVLGREPEVARTVGVPLEIVKERVRVLRRRDEVGRTGILVNRELDPDESFEEALHRLANSNPIVRRRLRAE